MIFFLTPHLPPRAAVLMVPIDPNDGFFKLAVTLPDDKIPDQPRLRNPEIDGSPDSASARIPFYALGSLSMYQTLSGGSWASLRLIMVVYLTLPCRPSVPLFLSSTSNPPFNTRLARPSVSAQPVRYNHIYIQKGGLSCSVLTSKIQVR